jgi:hypothetical protein
VSIDLKETFSKLPLDCKSKLNKSDLVVPCYISNEKVLIKILYNSVGQVQHLGINLFDFEDNLVYPSAILAFLERFSLQLFLVNDLPSLNKKISENKLFIRLNGIEITPINSNHLISIKRILQEKNLKTTTIERQKGVFRISVQKGNDSFELVLPSNYQVISGLDKLEYALQIEQRLTTYKEETKKMNYSKAPNELIPYSNGIYIHTKKDYFENISGNIYYKCDSIKNCLPVFHKSYFWETIQNSFLIPLAGEEKILKIHHKLYGNESLNYQLKLKDFVAFFQQDHSLYLGFESNDPDVIIGTLIIAHNNLDYINMLHIKFKSDNFFSGKNMFIEGELYTNIPSDNIKNIFAEYK